MKKNNYSLMLSEAVVNAIDAAAARAGTNRSALINQILAEYVCYVTPEMRAREILSRVHDALGIAFRRESAGESALALYSSLSYRYNPTVKYHLELYRAGDSLGELRVSLRSKNPVLLQLFARFCTLFIKIEQRYVGHTDAALGEGRLVRILRLRTDANRPMTHDSVGEAAASYIATFDKMLKGYFACLPDEGRAYEVMTAGFLAYLGNAGHIL